MFTQEELERFEEVAETLGTGKYTLPRDFGVYASLAYFHAREAARALREVKRHVEFMELMRPNLAASNQPDLFG